MNFDDAIKAHSDWKMKLRTAIMAKAKLDATTIARDDNCILGKWLHGESAATYGKLLCFGDCKRLHAAFHQEASKVAAVINAGKYAQAETMLGSGTPYATASNAVVGAITALKREARL